MPLEVLDEIRILNVEPKVRLSDYLLDKTVHLPSRKSIKKAFKKNLILKNNLVGHSGDYCKTGDLIQILKEEVPIKKVFPLKLEIVFEDDHLAVINKPSGYPVSGNYFKTIENALPFNLFKSSEKDALEYPRPIHRLDNPTSGVLVIAKTKSARVFLGQELEKGNFKKEYTAIIQGDICEKGLLQMPLSGQKAISHFNLIQKVPSLQSGFLSLIQVKIDTGRTHQIRKHLSSIGHPILGDKEYGEEGNVLKGKGMFLCALELIFKHPITGNDLQFKINPPNKFASQLKREKLRFEKFRQEVILLSDQTTFSQK